MMGKFTKGPWFVYDDRRFLILKGKVCVNDNDGEPIVVADTNHYFDEARANAALIAAAPDMYEMLDEISDGLLDAGGFGNCALAKRIEQLLAKARGEDD